MRGVPQSIQLLQRMQTNGLRWMELVRSREQVVQAMQYYLTRAAIDISAFPPVIHIAGTKGKGSTASMTESMLRAAGFRTGLFTSPHLVHVTERFRVDGTPVSDALYVHEFFKLWDELGGDALGEALPGEAPPFSTVRPGVGADGTSPLATIPPLPGFSFLTLLAIQLFTALRVDVVVLETGLGGRLDATNVFDPPTVSVCGITTLDFDHVETLGGTLPSIAAEKAGIFKPGVPAVTVHQRADAMATLCEVAAQRGTPLFVCDPSLLSARTPGGAHPPLGIGGRYSPTNAALAVALVDIFMHQHAMGRLPPSARTSLPEPRVASGAAATASAGGGGGRGDPPREVVPPPRRLSAFDDAFGASSANKPVVGRVVDPPRVYDQASPLPGWALAGLAGASWPGRAQVLRVDVNTGRAVEGGPLEGAAAATEPSPALTLYLDGAHTGRSMGEAVAWYAGCTEEGGGGGGAGAPPPFRVLLFNCGQDKDVVSLLLALSTVRWDAVILAGTEWALTRRAPSVTPTTALASFLARRTAMGDTQAVEDVRAGLEEEREADGEGGGADAAGGQVEDVGVDTPQAWQRTLGAILHVVHVGREYQRARARLAPLAGGDAGAVLDGGVQGAARAVELPTACPTPVVVPSGEAGVHLARTLAREKGGARHVHVLVTGSLYLVGAALAATGGAAS